jgi:hypothetical protein
MRPEAFKLYPLGTVPNHISDGILGIRLPLGVPYLLAFGRLPLPLLSSTRPQNSTTSKQIKRQDGESYRKITSVALA